MTDTSDNPTPYDTIILDVGGDEVITLSGPLANPEQVSAEVEKIRVARAKRLQAASPEQQEVFGRWKNGREPMYFRRFVNMPDDSSLVIYVSAPALREALTAEVNLGADASELASFTNMSLAGMIFGTFFSALEPDGEPGSAHVCDLEEIPFEAMEAASKKRWM